MIGVTRSETNNCQNCGRWGWYCEGLLDYWASGCLFWIEQKCKTCAWSHGLSHNRTCPNGTVDKKAVCEDYQPREDGTGPLG